MTSLSLVPVSWLSRVSERPNFLSSAPRVDILLVYVAAHQLVARLFVDGGQQRYWFLSDSVTAAGAGGTPAGLGIAALPACATEVRRPVLSGLRPLVSAGRARRCFSRNSALWYWPGSAKSGSAKSQLTCPSISEAAESIMFGPPNTFDGAAAD